jgi:hypothetical protein
MRKTGTVYHVRDTISSTDPYTTQHLLPEVLWAAEYIFGTLRGLRKRKGKVGRYRMLVFNKQE